MQTQMTWIFRQNLIFANIEEPTSFQKAANNEEWDLAVKEEIYTIEENKTWKLIDLSKGCKPVGLKWVFKLKKELKGI